MWGTDFISERFDTERVFRQDKTLTVVCLSLAAFHFRERQLPTGLPVRNRYRPTRLGPNELRAQVAPSWVGWGAVMYRRCLVQPTTGHEKKSSHLCLMKFALWIDDRPRLIIYSFWEEQPQNNECNETRPVPTRQSVQSLQACWARGNRTRAGLS